MNLLLQPRRACGSKMRGARLARAFALPAAFALAAAVPVAQATLTPARKISGIWETPFPVPVQLTLNDGLGGTAVAQAKMKVRWTIQARGKAARIRSKRVSAIRSFRIVDAGGGDPAILTPIAEAALRDLSVNTIFRGRISATRMDVRWGTKRVGRFTFTTDLMRGPYRYLPTPETLYTIKQLKFVKKR